MADSIWTAVDTRTLATGSGTTDITNAAVQEAPKAVLIICQEDGNPVTHFRRSIGFATSGTPDSHPLGYVHTGVETTARLIWFDDASTGLPITPNGEDINVTWDAGANKIFAL